MASHTAVFIIINSSIFVALSYTVFKSTESIRGVIWKYLCCMLGKKKKSTVKIGPALTTTSVIPPPPKSPPPKKV